MTADEYLSQIERLNTMINNKQKEKDEIFERMTSVGGIDYSKDRVQTSATSDQIPNAVIKLMEEEKEIDELIDKYCDYKRRVIKQLEELNTAEYRVLYALYVLGQSASELAEEYHYSERQIYNIRRRGLLEFESIHAKKLKNKKTFQ